MTTNLARFAVVLFVAVAVAVAVAPEAQANDGVDGADIKDTVKKSFDIRSGGTLAIDMDRGDVEVRSTGEQTVLIEVERIVDASSKDEAKSILDDHQLEMYKKGNDVVLRSRLEREGRNWKRWSDRERVRVRVVVRIPSKYNVDFATGAGNVLADDVDGVVEGETGAGNVKIGRISGHVTISSGSGNVEIDGALGSVEVNTGAGNISIGEVGGEVVANSGAGNITATITRQPPARSRLETGAGNVTVYLAGDVGIDVLGETGLGSADTDFGLKVEGKWMSKSFKGSVNGGGPALTMRSGVGNVRLKSR